ncbi:MAG: hypothetical protein HQ583_01340 [Candidatus Abyssubacteria bacterium]|nr:hypothetical protein [Candidatus Abyssubacteria bacterium]
MIKERESTQEKQTTGTLDANERGHILRLLRSTGDDKAQAARIPGIQRSTLHKKIRKHGISPDPITENLLEENRR